jgi:hypothetical protein
MGTWCDLEMDVFREDLFNFMDSSSSCGGASSCRFYLSSEERILDDEVDGF